MKSVRSSPATCAARSRGDEAARVPVDSRGQAQLARHLIGRPAERCKDLVGKLDLNCDHGVAHHSATHFTTFALSRQ